MKKSKFTEAQIIIAIKQSETGVKVEEVFRKIGTSEATFIIGRRSTEVWAYRSSESFSSWRRRIRS